MFDLVSSPWVLQGLAINLAVSGLVFVIGFLVGKRRERRLLSGRNLEQYQFYPFSVDADGFPQFNLALFERAVEHLLRHPDATAAGQLVVIGEQNGVRYQLGAEALSRYEKFYARYHGQRVMQDSSEFLENYRRMVRLFGATFRDMGIEVLLHDLVNPQRLVRRLCRECSRAVTAAESGLAELGLGYMVADAPDLREAGTGCDACRQTGYRGRTAIHELLHMDDTVRGYIMQRGDAATLRDVCTARGMHTIRDDGADKVRSGVTSVAEALRVTAVDVD